MKYSKENFMSVLNQVKNVCIRENQNIIFRSLLSEEFNKDTIKAIKNSIDENNLNTIDEIVKLTRIVESITHGDVTDIIHKITDLFMNYNEIKLSIYESYDNGEIDKIEKNILLERLEERYSEEDIRRIWGGNFLRVMEEVQKV